MMDGIHGREAHSHIPDVRPPAYHQNVHYMMQGRELHHLSNGHVTDHHDQEDNNGAGGGSDHIVEGNGPSDSGNMYCGNNNQLTLSFQGQVYVFDFVSPEKVQAVLLLLGGHKVPPSMPTIPITSHHNNRELSSTPQPYGVPQRLASLIRFREKRKERNFDRKIRYTVRKEVAVRMQRKKGQFTSSKPSHDDSTSAITNWDSDQSCSLDVSGSKHQEILCRHCGISGKSTPMMRRGPEGPRTLCNACGLMWANKGTLRDISKTPQQLAP